MESSIKNPIEIDFDDFVKNIFNNNPKDPHSIVLTTDCSDIKTLFERLLTIFHEGTIILYGDEDNKVDLSLLNESDFENLNRYFHSFGINVHYKVCHVKTVENLYQFILNQKELSLTEEETLEIETNALSKPEVVDILDYKSIRSDKLEDCKFKVKVKNIYYIIWFSIVHGILK